MARPACGVRVRRQRMGGVLGIRCEPGTSVELGDAARAQRAARKRRCARSTWRRCASRTCMVPQRESMGTRFGTFTLPSFFLSPTTHPYYPFFFLKIRHVQSWKSGDGVKKMGIHAKSHYGSLLIITPPTLPRGVRAL